MNTVIRQVTVSTPKPHGIQPHDGIRKDADHFVFQIGLLAQQFRAYSEFAMDVLVDNVGQLSEASASIADTMQLVRCWADEPEEGDLANDAGTEDTADLEGTAGDFARQET